MCKFVNKQLTVNTDVSDKALNYEVFLKVTEPKEYYRFRLLWFTDETDRKTPFVERFMHAYFSDTPEGGRSVETIVCPTTPFVRATWAGNAYDDCPVCRFATNNYVVLKETNYTDKVARENNRQFKRKFQAVIPVYVISDPVYDANNGKLKVFTINDKDIYEKFKRVVIEQNAKSNVFNSENALDFLMRLDNVEHVLNAGTDKEIQFTRREIVQMGFSKKPYTIDAITSENINKFPFAGIYYTPPTAEELRDYYKANCLQSSDDDIDMDSMTELSDKPADKPTKPAEPETFDDDESAMDDEDGDDIADVGAMATPEGDDEEGSDTLEPATKSKAKKTETVKTEPAKKVAKKAVSEEDDDKIDVDALLDDIGL